LNNQNTITAVKQLISQGLPNKQIQNRLGVSNDVVRYWKRKEYPELIKHKVNKIDWTLYDDLLLTLKPVALAKLIGCHRETVMYRRRTKQLQDNRRDPDVFSPPPPDVWKLYRELYEKHGAVTRQDKLNVLCRTYGASGRLTEHFVKTNGSIPSCSL
jgi:hypothetical protein